MREFFRLPRPQILQVSADAKVRPWWATLAALLAVFLVLKFAVRPAVSWLVRTLFAPAGRAGAPHDALFGLVSEVAQLLTFSAIIALCVLYVVAVEHRRARTLGFVRRRALRTYAAGLALGGLSFLLVFAASWALGAIESVQLNPDAAYGALAALFVGYAVQSMGEETLSRGLVLGSLGARYPMGVALAVSSVTFGLMHSLNSGVTVLAVVNIVLVGWALGLMFIKTGDLWLCGGFHCMWNFTQGPLVGMAVSGSARDPFTLLQSTMGASSELISGGAFGLEAGIMTTVVAVVLVIALSLMKPCSEAEKKTRVIHESERNEIQP